MMKRSTRKLAIRSETIRALSQLDLVLVAAANAHEIEGTGNAGTSCPLKLAAESGNAGTGCQIV
jgi:hypothetical protein